MVHASTYMTRSHLYPLLPPLLNSSKNLVEHLHTIERYSSTLLLHTIVYLYSIVGTFVLPTLGVLTLLFTLQNIHTAN